jgi:lipopolysaccharide/colanic/teichoic acid biosynthesis glycosyltransferase
MVPAESAESASSKSIAGPDEIVGRGDRGQGMALPQRRQLHSLADVVKLGHDDLRHSWIDITRISSIERMLHGRLLRNRRTFVVKRVVDILGAAFALILLLPLLMLTALAMKVTSPGPVIYSQVRHGRRGTPFRIYKFRSLYTGHCDESGISQIIPGDRRISPIGKILRRTNIDELPQLWNVLKGDMSLVGPRPHAIGMCAGGTKYEHLVLVYPMRTLVKPGITGLAQLRGFRGPTLDRTSARMRVLCDLQYLAECSNMHDIKIIALTILQELRGGTGG